MRTGNDGPKTEWTSFGIDTAPPTIPSINLVGTPGTNSWFKSNITVTITAGNDVTSGVRGIQYYTEKGSTGGQVITGDIDEKYLEIPVTDGETTNSTGSTSITITTDGITKIHARTVDNAGNVSGECDVKEAKKDTVDPPTVSLTYNSSTANTVTVTTAMSSTTDTSGIAKYVFEYKKSAEGDTAWKTATEATTRPNTYEYANLDSSTAYNFRVKTIDNAGRESTGNTVSGTTENRWENSNVDEVKVGDGESVPRPDGTAILNLTATIDEGIIMQDQKENQWVWIPVDEATYNSMFTENTAGIALRGSTGVTTTKYSTSARLIGQTQGNPGSMSWREPDLVLGNGGASYDYSNYPIAGFSSLADMATKLVSEYITMTNSIRKYGGFYIGRYELSANGVKSNQSPTMGNNWYSLYKQCNNLTVDGTKGMTRMIWRMPMGRNM